MPGGAQSAKAPTVVGKPEGHCDLTCAELGFGYILVGMLRRVSLRNIP